ncbi:MAG: hypothetical protein ABSF44_10665 [Candidatus Bathyarchaeia archaeon]|jgi:hypothetical protein
MVKERLRRVEGKPMAGSLAKTQETEGIYITLENPSNEQFDEVLVQAIDEVFTSLGEPVKNAFYQHLEEDFNISKNEIPKKIAEFSDIIHKIFGLGASRLERNFIRELNSKVQSNVEFPEYEGSLSKWIIREVSFEEYIQKARESYETQGSKTLP